MHHETRTTTITTTRRPAGHTLLAALLTAVVLSCALPAIAAGRDAAPAVDPSPATDRLDLNAATIEQLQAVPGIGPATAARIVAFRDEHGPFRRVEDLVKVRGIGETTFQKIRRYVRVSAER